MGVEEHDEELAPQVLENGHHWQMAVPSATDWPAQELHVEKTSH